MAKPCVFDETPCPQFVTIDNQHATRQNAQRTFQNTHVLIEDQWANAGALQQRYHR